MKKFLILFAVALIGMSACNVDPKDEFIIYNDTELCSIVDGKIITDNGLTYEIVENNTEANLAEYNRAIIVCDILKLNEDGSYQINLKSITKIQIKDYTDASTLPEGVIPTGYPVSPQSIWFSGGYLNVGFSFYLKVNSSTVHNIDIIALNYYARCFEKLEKIRLPRPIHGSLCCKQIRISTMCNIYPAVKLITMITLLFFHLPTILADVWSLRDTALFGEIYKSNLCLPFGSSIFIGKLFCHNRNIRLKCPCQHAWG